MNWLKQLLCRHRFYLNGFSTFERGKMDLLRCQKCGKQLYTPFSGEANQQRAMRETVYIDP